MFTFNNSYWLILLKLNNFSFFRIIILPKDDKSLQYFRGIFFLLYFYNICLKVWICRVFHENLFIIYISVFVVHKMKNKIRLILEIKSLGMLSVSLKTDPILWGFISKNLPILFLILSFTQTEILISIL